MINAIYCNCRHPQDGAPVGCRVQKRLIFVAEKTMVYGRYITIVHGAYKPTYNWGAPSCKGLPIHSLNVDIPAESSPGAK